MGRKVELSDEEVTTLELEIKRLEGTHGLRVTLSQLVSILIAQHRLKLRIASEQEGAQDVLAWVWRKRNGEGD